MTIFLLIVAVLLALALWYALAGRAWLKRQSWAQGFFAWIEPLEIALYQKSETMLLGRLTWFAGLLVTLYDGAAVFFQSLDLTPVTTRIFDALSVPQDLRGVVGAASLTALGLMITWLRKRTTKPLEVVAVPSTAPPAVAQAVAQVEVSNAIAVAVATDAKAAA